MYDFQICVLASSLMPLNQWIFIYWYYEMNLEKAKSDY